MAGRGRRPIPSAIKLVQGTYNTTRANKKEPAPPRVRPHPPKGLEKKYRETFDEVCDHLESLKVLTSADSLMVEFASYWIREARLVMRDARASRMERLQVARDARLWLSEWGGTPASRTKVEQADPGGDDPFGEFV